MATSGLQAWQKYFSSSEEIETSLKKECVAYHHETRQRIDTILQEDQKVIVVPHQEYDPRILVRLPCGQLHRVKFDLLKKPRKNGIELMKLKPQNFSIVQKPYTAKELAEIIIADLDKDKKMKADLKNYLKHLVGYYGDIKGYTLNRLRDSYDPKFLQHSEVKKDFGEIVGQLQAVRYGALNSVGLDVSKRQRISFPLQGNEPLVDYFIHDQKIGKISVSQKTQGSTNTVKPDSILALLRKSGNEKKWQNTKELEVFKALEKNPVAIAPLQLLKIMRPQMIDDAHLRMQKAFKKSNLETKDYDFNDWKDLIMQIPQLRDMNKEPLIGEIVYFTEQYVLQLINEKLDIGSIFQDQTKGQIVFLKFQITNSNPEGKFQPLAPDLLENRKRDKIKLRSGNSRNRIQDKVGIQPSL